MKRYLRPLGASLLCGAVVALAACSSSGSSGSAAGSAGGKGPSGTLTIVNASATFTPRQAAAFSIRLWAKNLTNKEYYSIEYEEQGPAGFAASPAAPRTFGGEFRFRF